jgi:threonine/homoserine efflux transporter RhtA
MTQVLNVLISAAVITLAAWISRRNPGIAGFMVAMPVATLLVLPLSYIQHGDSTNTFDLARSIFIAIPVTLAFFLPFLVGERFGLGFWGAYALGAALLPAAFLVHRQVSRLF